MALPPSDDEEFLLTIEEEETKLLQDDLYSFVESAWKVMEPERTFKGNWHIGAICDHLNAVRTGEIKRLIINVPPRHLKSYTVSVFWPAWMWIHKPGIKWLFLAYGKNLVLRDAVKTRRLITSEWYQQRWGDRYQLLGDQNTKANYENDKGGVRLTSSFESDPTGEGADIGVIDDPLQITDAYNEGALEHVNNTWDGVLSTRLNDPSEGVWVGIMQRLSENDWTGHVMKEGGWVHLRLPTEFEARYKCVTYLPKDAEYLPKNLKEKPIGKPGAKPFFEDPRTVEGELLHPDRADAKYVAGLKSKGEVNFAGQQQQRPVPLQGNLFKRHWWKFYDFLPTDLNIFQDSCASWDMSYKDKKDSAFVSCTIWARKSANEIYLLYRLHRKMAFPDTLKAFQQVHEMFPFVPAKLVEAKANGIAIIQTLQSQIPGIIEIEPDGGKEVRAMAVAYMPQNGMIYLPHPDNAPWVEEFIDEFASFPGGAFKDDVDSSTQAWYHWFHSRPAAAYDTIDLLSIGKGEPMVQNRRVF